MENLKAELAAIIEQYQDHPDKAVQMAVGCLCCIAGTLETDTHTLAELFQLTVTFTKKQLARLSFRGN